MAGIVKGKDIKLNVQPVTISIYHEYVFEGPCRFGEGEQLTKDYDLMRIAMIHKGFVDEVQEKLGSLDFINIMEPIVIKRDETFPVTDELLDEMGKDAAETDLYLIKFHPFGHRLRAWRSPKNTRSPWPASCSAATTRAWWPRAAPGLRGLRLAQLGRRHRGHEGAARPQGAGQHARAVRARETTPTTPSRRSTRSTTTTR